MTIDADKLEKLYSELGGTVGATKREITEMEMQDRCNWHEEMMTVEELDRINEIFSDVPQMQIKIYGDPPKPGIGYGRKGFKAAYQKQAMAFIDELFDFDREKCLDDISGFGGY